MTKEQKNNLIDNVILSFNNILNICYHLKYNGFSILLLKYIERNLIESIKNNVK